MKVVFRVGLASGKGCLWYVGIFEKVFQIGESLVSKYLDILGQGLFWHVFFVVIVHCFFVVNHHLVSICWWLLRSIKESQIYVNQLGMNTESLSCPLSIVGSLSPVSIPRSFPRWRSLFTTRNNMFWGKCFHIYSCNMTQKLAIPQ